jgi:Sec-independent protein translocase protein TatA
MSKNAGRAMRELNRNTQELSARLQNELDEKAVEKPDQAKKEKPLDVS